MAAGQRGCIVAAPDPPCQRLLRQSRCFLSGEKGDGKKGRKDSYTASWVATDVSYIFGSLGGGGGRCGSDSGGDGSAGGGGGAVDGSAKLGREQESLCRE